MMARRWTSRSEPGTTGWHFRLRFMRVEIGWHVYRHRSSVGRDRWVFQPFAIYDRKATA